MRLINAMEFPMDSIINRPNTVPVLQMQPTKKDAIKTHKTSQCADLISKASINNYTNVLMFTYNSFLTLQFKEKITTINEDTQMQQ